MIYMRVMQAPALGDLRGRAGQCDVMNVMSPPQTLTLKTTATVKRYAFLTQEASLDPAVDP